MANNETTTKFRVDISELKKSMQEARRSVAVANSEFQAVSSTMDDWTKSSDGLRAKLNQLGSNLNDQKKILSNYEKQLELTMEQYPNGGKAVDDLIIKINKQKAVVNNTQRQIDSYTQSLEEVVEAEKEAAKSGKSVTEVLEDMGDKAEETSDGFTTFKGAIASFAGNMLTGLVSAVGEGISAIVGLADETREYRTELGKLETAFTTAGFTTETATNTYKDFYAVLGDEGQAVEAVNHLSQLAESEEDLAKWTTIATGVYGTFGDSLPIENLTEAANETAKTGQITGGLADALNWAGVSEAEFQASLDACTTEQERQALITDTLNGLYSEAADTYKEVNGDIMDAQRAQSELADATANLGAVAEPVMTTFKTMGAAFLNELLPSVTELGGGFTDLMNGVEGADQRIGASIGDLVNVVLGKVTELLPQVLSVGLSLVTTLITGILNALPQLATTAIEMVGTILEALATALPQIALAIVDAVPKIIDALMGMLPTLIDSVINFLLTIVDAIPTVVTAIVNALPQVITSIVNGLLQGATALLEGAITLLMAIVDAIPEIITALVTALPQIITTLITTLLNAIPLLLDSAIQLLMAIIDAIPTIIVSLVQALPTLITSIIGALLNAIPLLLETAITLLMAIVEAIPTIIVELVKAVPEIVTAIITALFELVPQLGTLLSDTWNSFKKWIVNLTGTAKTEVPKIINKVVEFFKQLPSKIWTWLVNVVNKVAEWRNNMIAKAIELGTSFVNNLISFIKELPSKVWTWLVNVVSKVAEWRNNLVSKAVEAGKGLVDSLINAVKDLPDKMKEIGSSIVEGIFSGISNGWSWLKDSVSDLAGSLFESAKKALGINSPSKVFADEVGRWIPEGIAVGIDKNAKSVLQSVKDVTVDAVSSARAGLSSADTVSATGTTVGAGGVTYNFYQTNNSPKALSRLEIYRQSKNLLGFAGGM